MHFPRMLKAAALPLLLLLTVALPTFAQLDVGSYQLEQDGITVGQIFVPERDPEDCTYREYWYLHEGYVYPSRSNGVGFTLEADAEATTQSVEEFLAEVEAKNPGGRLVIVDSTEIRQGC